MAESVAPATDPLNLMRVMPSKGARVPIAGLATQPCATAHGFLFNHEWTRIDTNDFEPDICVPLFVIPSEVEGSLDISVHL